MAKNAKPRKPRVPVPLVIPGLPNKRDGWLAEGGVHAALLALEGRRFLLAHLGGLVAHASLVMRICKKDPVHVRTAILDLIRFCALLREQVPKADPSDDFQIEVPGEVDLGIRRCVRITLPWLRKQPDDAVLRAALDAISTLDKKAKPTPE